MQNDGHYDNLETALADNFIQDQKKDAFDEYNNGGEDPDVDVRDEELADPRAYPRPKPWKWLKRINILCTISCLRYHYCWIKGLSLSILEDVNIPLVVIAISLPRRRSNA